MGTRTLISMIALFGFSALTSFVTSWLILVSPAIRMFTDRPGGRKVHQKITPRIGGISIVILFLLFSFIWHFSLFMNLPPLNPNLFNAVIFGTIGIAVIGFVDDVTLFSINSSTKFTIEVVIAVLLVAISGIKLDTLHFLGQTYTLGVAAWPITVLWLVGVTNALNIIDGVDGLAGTISLVSFCTIGILAQLRGDYSIVIFCTLCAGLIVGFLAHNIPPARIFLGDTGSLFFGMTIGLLGAYLVSATGRSYPLIVAPLIVGFPLVDVTLAISRRFFKALANGESIFQSLLKTMDADNDHIHHRLMFRGLRHSQTTIVIAIYAVTTCAVAVVISMVQGISTVFFLIYLTLITGWFTYKLGFFDRLTNLYHNSHNQDWNSQSNSKIRTNVIVLNADEYLRHALGFFKQDVFSLNFMEIGEKNDESIMCSAVILNCTHIDNQAEELSQAINLAVRFQCPIVMIADEFAVSSWERTKKLAIKTLFVRKPIYVPKLFNDMYIFAINSDSAPKFAGAYSNEKTMSPLIGRNNESI
jgi:UDP-GlcNAc:undecaprenyl-phosphate/decaprenyl-phosphate GlcNAc-1-phosphate transferase